MIKPVNFDSRFTEGLAKVFNSRNSVVTSITMTCDINPEQYDCFDKKGRKIAYLRYRFGNFTVECPDCRGETVYKWKSDDGFGCYFDEAERIEQFDAALRAIDKYYSPLNFFRRPFTPIKAMISDWKWRREMKKFLDQRKE